MARGTPALVTQGGSMSRPILERLGFEPVGHVHMLLDEFDRPEARANLTSPESSTST
jgi:hypothetical protein